MSRSRDAPHALCLCDGELDTRITSGWPDFDSAPTAAHVPHEGFIYKGANHGFHNDTRVRPEPAIGPAHRVRPLAGPMVNSAIPILQLFNMALPMMVSLRSTIMRALREG